MSRELTVREAAKRVGRAEETVRRWIWSGKLPARKLGNVYRLLEQDVDAVAAGVPAPRKSAEDGAAPSLGQWLADVRRWQAGNGVAKRPGAWRLVVQERTERSGLAGR